MAGKTRGPDTRFAFCQNRIYHARRIGASWTEIGRLYGCSGEVVKLWYFRRTKTDEAKDVIQRRQEANTRWRERNAERLATYRMRHQARLQAAEKGLDPVDVYRAWDCLLPSDAKAEPRAIAA